MFNFVDILTHGFVVYHIVVRYIDVVSLRVVGPLSLVKPLFAAHHCGEVL